MNNDEREIIEVRIGKVWLDADGILRWDVLLPNAELTLDDSKAIIAACRRLGGGIARPALSDIRNLSQVNRETRTYGVSEEAASVVSASALLVGSPVSRMVGNFFLRVSRPPYPTQLFTSEAKAIEWLKGFIAPEDRPVL